MKDFMKKLNKKVDPVIAWSAYGGAVVLSVILALIFWL